jgi:hypothetical protein
MRYINRWKELGILSGNSIEQFIQQTEQKDKGEGFVVIQPFEEAYVGAKQSMS